MALIVIFLLTVKIYIFYNPYGVGDYDTYDMFEDRDSPYVDNDENVRLKHLVMGMGASKFPNFSVKQKLRV